MGIGDAAPPPKKKTAQQLPDFLAHVYCGQIGWWIKMPLGTEIVLSPGHIVLDREPAPLNGSQQPLPQFLASV